VKPNAVNERVVAYWPGVCGTLAQRLAIGLSGSPHVSRGYRSKWNPIDRVHLDLA
jgi:hypothetical protein